MRHIKALPKDTLMFCGHEYTLTSFAFAHWLEPTNDAIRRRLEWVQHRRFGLMDKPGSTLPSTIATELACVSAYLRPALLPHPSTSFRSRSRSRSRSLSLHVSLLTTFSCPCAHTPASFPQLQSIPALSRPRHRRARGLRPSHLRMHCASGAFETSHGDKSLLVDPRGSPRLVPLEGARAVPFV